MFQPKIATILRTSISLYWEYFSYHTSVWYIQLKRCFHSKFLGTKGRQTILGPPPYISLGNALLTQTTLHTGLRESIATLLLRRFSPTGKASLQALQRKCLIFGRTFKPQILFQCMELGWAWDRVKGEAAKL